MDERKIMKGFYESVRKTFFACRIAGYWPIIGLLNKKSHNSRCVWISKYSIYYGISLLLPVVFTSIHLYYALHKRGFRDLGGLIFRCFAVLSTVLLIRFSITWEKMIKEIEDIERLLPPFKHPELIFKNINRVMFFILIFGIMNYLIHLTLTVRMIVLTDLKDDELTIEMYYITYYRWLFRSVSFTYVTVILLQLTEVQTPFVYYFIDSLVIMVTIYLVYRFRNFNRMMRIRQTKCEKNRNILWMDLQAQYTRLARLVKLIDDHINPFVFLSFLSNLVFICKHIYDAIQLRKYSDISYDWIVILDSVAKITFLIFRSWTVSSLVAHMYTLSREPLKVLHTLPASAYTPEVQRFMDQVHHSNITLSGLGFFYVTRGTILSMLSTIITYELVLLQQPVIYSE